MGSLLLRPSAKFGSHKIPVSALQGSNPSLRSSISRLLRQRRSSVARPVFPGSLPEVAHSLRSSCSADCRRPRAVRRPSSLPRWRLLVRISLARNYKGPDPFDEIGVRPLRAESLSFRGSDHPFDQIGVIGVRPLAPPSAERCERYTHGVGASGERERSSRSDHLGFRGSRPEVSRCHRV